MLAQFALQLIVCISIEVLFFRVCRTHLSLHIVDTTVDVIQDASFIEPGLDEIGLLTLCTNQVLVDLGAELLCDFSPEALSVVIEFIEHVTTRLIK